MTVDKNVPSVVPNRRFARHPGLWIALAVVAFVLVIALAYWRVLARFLSMPQRTVVMAIYPEGSLNAELVKHYHDLLARNGIDLILMPSAGAVESIALLRNPDSATSIALIPGGITDRQKSPELVSLGAVFYEPIWVFSRPHVPHRHKQLRGLRISIGPEGSSSRSLALKLLGRAGVIDEKSAALLSLTPSESAHRLMDGDIDMAIFLDAWESPAVQQLLSAKDIRLESIRRADAFVALYPFLSKLVLPAGVVNMAEARPAKDVVLIAPKCSLVVRKDLHPAIQYLLLEAAVEIHSPPGMFHSVGQFPAPESTDLPLSAYAREFYKSGTPFLLRHLPFWLAVFIAQPVVWLLVPLLVLLIPLFRLAPVIYDWAEKRRIYRFYSELMILEDEILASAPGEHRRDFLERLDRLEARASRLSVPPSFKGLVYSLRLHIDVVRGQVQKVTTKD